MKALLIGIIVTIMACIVAVIVTVVVKQLRTVNPRVKHK